MLLTLVTTIAPKFLRLGLSMKNWVFEIFSQFKFVTLCLIFLFPMNQSIAQSLPELDAPSSLSGASTTAQFFAGASGIDDVIKSAFQFTESPKLQIQIVPESTHIGTSGKLYVLAIVNGSAFALSGPDSWVSFDGTIPGLGGVQDLGALASTNEIIVANLTDLFALTGVVINNGQLDISVFVAYDTSAAPDNLFFSGLPANFSITNSSLQRDRTLPELSLATAISENPTTSRFYGGASVRNSGAFTGSLQSSDDASVLVEFEPEFSLIGSSGNGYVLASVGGALFSLLDTGEWIVFDGTVEGLGGAASYPSLQSFQQINADSVVTLLDREGVETVNGNTEIAVFVAYDSSARTGELFFSGAPMVFTLISTASNNAAAIFEESVAQPIVQARCIACHFSGGIAGNTGLIFQSGNDAANFTAFQQFAASRSDALDYILSKATGGLAHQGGQQLAPGGSDFLNLQSFLDALINGSGGVTTAGASFFNGVGLHESVDTLRRAAIILAGRAPTQQEIDAVSNGDEATLRSVLRGLMTGDGFHRFLTDGANDRLLVRGVPDGTFLDGGGIFPNFTNTNADIQLADRARGLNWSFDQARFINGIDRGLRNSPLELIAYVVENERPYSEVLTADYMMLNSIANFAVDGTASFDDPEDYSEFQPGQLNQYYVYSDDYESEFIDEIQNHRILNPGSRSYRYPHAGILNTQAYLFRYPTTATNRNRARARWTFLHFLDIDIERSAQRTTDPVALADTNNPTMFNNNCTVCHATMDPVAGAFQNYAEEGVYKADGDDSLDPFYKYADGGNTLYQEGDTWYRDMRAPGLLGQTAPDSDNSLQWLSSHIVQQPGFARGTIKFWWPAVFGRPALLQPEVATDATYQSQLLAFDEQSKTIQELAESFVSNGMNLKDTFVDMLMSPWFRANRVDEQQMTSTQVIAHEIANLGDEKLLTPEQLAEKTALLTGFRWQSDLRFDNQELRSGLADDYGLFYGGIDSEGVTKRSTEMTPLMSTVAIAHASESACPIVLRDFALPDGSRKLFNNINGQVTPFWEASSNFSLPTSYSVTGQQAITEATLNAGEKQVSIGLLNGFCDWNPATQQCEAQTYLGIDRIEIEAPNGAITSIEPTPQTANPQQNCGFFANGDDAVLYGACTIDFPFTATASGNYRITATVSPLREGGDHPDANQLDISIGANTVTESVATSSAAGVSLIKSKLIELHQTLHGQFYDINSVEITAAYQLWVDSWQDNSTAADRGEYTMLGYGRDSQCNWWQDATIFDGLDLGFQTKEIYYGDPDAGDYPYEYPSEATGEFIDSARNDPLFTKTAWVTVLTYMLSHYNFLHE